MKQPDRFERMVGKHCVLAKNWMGHLPVMPDTDIIKLLRREHQAVKRKVKSLKWCRPIDIRKQGYNNAIDEILNWLEARGE